MVLRLSKKYLSFTDLIGEMAFAVIMVIIINGYVALSDLNTGFWYIVGVNLVACWGWGVIDGLIYITSSSIDRNEERKKAIVLKSAKGDETSVQEVKKAMNGTFLDAFDEDGKDKIAREIVENSTGISIDAEKLVTREEFMGGLSIFLIYTFIGFVLALPFLIMPDKFNAWLVSNLIGSAFLFYYGTQLGKSLGRNKFLLGLGMSCWGLVFLVLSYVVWT